MKELLFFVYKNRLKPVNTMSTFQPMKEFVHSSLKTMF